MLIVVWGLLPGLAWLLYTRLVYHRKKQFAAFPQLPPSLVWGHLKALHEFVLRGKRDRHIGRQGKINKESDSVFSDINKELNHPPLFLLDTRPVQSPALCVVCRHDIADQVAGVSAKFPFSTPKAPGASHVLRPLLGATSIVSVESKQWKTLRQRFNPGFSHRHLVSLLPRILGKVEQFHRALDGYAVSGEEFAFGDLCVSLTLDVIGAVTMDADLHAQSNPDTQSEIVKAFRGLIRSYRSDEYHTWELSRLTRSHRRERLSRKLDTLLKEHIQRTFAAQQQTRKIPTSPASSRSILGLSLHGLDKLDNNLLQQTSDQLKTFLFAGHDTTSTVLQWAIYELSRTPRALRAIRDELNSIFGTESDSVHEKLLSAHSEELIRKMVYTSAVIRETLRLYPPSGTARYTPPGTGFCVQMDDGQSVCLDGLVIYNCETIIHRDSAVYGPSSNIFTPERWLEGTGNSTSIPATAWRPFERGPRSCIGQELANLQIRVILACVVRRYELFKVGLGEVVRGEDREGVLGEHGQFKVKSEVFNIMQVTAKPVDGMRMTVAFARDGLV
ncbi:cytochrome P450 [Aspergillus affinis]|uniref:cytochrome P450 n=1 Tax=Aspergillus affinis TaxID=1070780 RepID=UPI0022FEE880|nr:cytochrome P450 [Aspergillus affinis]KAI9039120.1 cytochrome P450 [Aspergillus affinis]